MKLFDNCQMLKLGGDSTKGYKTILIGLIEGLGWGYLTIKKQTCCLLLILLFPQSITYP